MALAWREDEHGGRGGSGVAAERLEYFAPGVVVRAFRLFGRTLIEMIFHDDTIYYDFVRITVGPPGTSSTSAFEVSQKEGTRPGRQITSSSREVVSP
jgi:hypothetical protein